MKRIALILAILMIFTILFSGCNAAIDNQASATDNTAQAFPKPDDTSVTSDTQITEAVEITGLPSSDVTDGSASPSEIIGYEFVTETYTNEGIVINYPQVSGLTDTPLQADINERIRQSALRDVDDIAGEESKYEYELNSDVTLNTPNIISIRFDGYMNFEGAAHPSMFLYTFNLDIDNMKTIKLTDLINISDSFISLLRDGKYFELDTEITEPEWQQIIRSQFDEIDVDSFKDADTDISFISSYLTPSSLVVSIPVPHVIGDHIEIPVKYSDLNEYKIDSEIWNSLS